MDETLKNLVLFDLEKIKHHVERGDTLTVVRMLGELQGDLEQAYAILMSVNKK